MNTLNNCRVNPLPSSISPRARNRFNQVVEGNGSYVEKCAESKNQTLKRIGWYTKVLCATEYPRGMQYLKIALKWGTLAGL